MVADWLRSWKLVSWRTAIVAAVVVYALIGFFVVPKIAKKLIGDIARERTGREVTVGEVSCNPFTLSLTVRGFSMPDRPGTVLLSFDELYANAQLSSVFRWAGTLKELRVENPYLGVRRFSDGGVNLVELLDDIKQRTPTESTDDGGGLPRVFLQHILVTGTEMDVEDHAREEPLEWKFGPSRFELHDISTIPDTQGENAFVIAMKRGGTIRVDGDVVVEPLGLDGMVVVEGLVLENAWAALAPFFQFALVDGTAGARFKYSLALTEAGPNARLYELNTRVENTEVTAGSDELSVLKVSSFAISDASIAWPSAVVRVPEILAEGAEALQWIRPDGTPSWDTLVPKETREVVVETYQKVEEAFPWDIGVDRFEIRESTARVEDRTFPEPEQLLVQDASLVVTDFHTGPGEPWGLNASAVLPGEGRAAAEGFVTTSPWGLEADVTLTNLSLNSFQPYVERIAPIDLRAGRVEASGIARVAGDDEGSLAEFAGDVTIHEIDLRETAVGSTVLKWGRVDAVGIDAGVGPLTFEMASLDVHGAGIEVVVSEEGKINLIELLKVMAEKTEAESGEEAAEQDSAKLPITVDEVALHGCSAAYTDRTLDPPFTMAVDPVDGTVTGVKTDAVAGAAIEIDGPVRSGGMVHIEGEMDLFDPKRLTDLAIDVRQADMPPASPMAVRIVGHPMDEGKVDIDLDYEVTNSVLVGNNRFVTHGLVLGERVEGDRAVDLPVKLGVSMLTDKEGKITLEFPIEGDLDDPNFGLGNAIGSAVKEITAELVKSPFRLLGKLGGGSGDEDFGFVEFAAGTAELSDHERDKLTTLAAGADQRPELVLLVEGALDPAADAKGLQGAFLEALVAEQVGDDTGPALREFYESTYRTAASAEALREMQARHQGEEGLDETSYYRELRDAVIDTQPVDEAVLGSLAGARAEAIRVHLVDELSVAAERLRITDPVTLEESPDEKWVRCRLDVATGG
jgi:hypothetical protein